MFSCNQVLSVSKIGCPVLTQKSVRMSRIPPQLPAQAAPSRPTAPTIRVIGLNRAAMAPSTDAPKITAPTAIRAPFNSSRWSWTKGIRTSLTNDLTVVIRVVEPFVNAKINSSEIPRAAPIPSRPSLKSSNARPKSPASRSSAIAAIVAEIC